MSDRFDLKSGDRAFKTSRLMFKVFFNVNEVKQNLLRKGIKRTGFKNMDYRIHRKKLITQIFKLGKRLKLS